MDLTEELFNDIVGSAQNGTLTNETVIPETIVVDICEDK